MQATARAQPNIALIKYWGKRDTERNLPAVGSISITLDELYTEITVAFEASLGADVLTLNGAPAPDMLPRMSRCIDRVAGADRPAGRIDSVCNFPVAAGLASSASSFAAAAVAAAAAAGRDYSTAELASLAGQASGSAARSLYGGFVELANVNDDIALDVLIDEAAWPLRVVVAITDAAAKKTGSTEAMEISRRTSPFYGRWLDEQPRDLDAARDAILARDFDRLADVAEHSCLKMHSLTWTSRPPVVYWNATTLECLQAVRELRAAGVGVFFTADAGPQVKAVCLPDAAGRVADTLSAVAGVSHIIESGIGAGARRVDAR